LIERIVAFGKRYSTLRQAVCLALHQTGPGAVACAIHSSKQNSSRPSLKSPNTGPGISGTLVLDHARGPHTNVGWVHRESLGRSVGRTGEHLGLRTRTRQVALARASDRAYGCATAPEVARGLQSCAPGADAPSNSQKPKRRAPTLEEVDRPLLWGGVKRGLSARERGKTSRPRIGVCHCPAQSSGCSASSGSISRANYSERPLGGGAYAGRCALLGSDPREISQIVLGFSNDLRISACIAITSRTLVSAVCIDAI
jgi:hypothetical protein